MSKNKTLPIKEVVKSYDALLVDIWGVIYDGVNPYEGAVSCINSMIEDGKKVIFLSNNPRKYDFAKDKLVSFGINMDKALIYTSGDAVREQLVSWNDEVFKTLGRVIYHLGENRNKEILTDIDVELTSDITKADFILITAYIDEGEDLSEYDQILTQAAALKIPAICANPDVSVNQANGIRYCSGSIGKSYEAMGGVVHYYGKPDIRIFNTVLNRYLSEVDKSKILMIGDTIDTDILGANKTGIDSVLVLTGNGQESINILTKTDPESINLERIPTWISGGMF